MLPVADETERGRSAGPAIGRLSSRSRSGLGFGRGRHGGSRFGDVGIVLGGIDFLVPEQVLQAMAALLDPNQREAQVDDLVPPEGGSGQLLAALLHLDRQDPGAAREAGDSGRAEKAAGLDRDEEVAYPLD